MPTVTLKFKENIIGEYQIEKGKSLTIGRQENNDITIENLAVSGHCRLRHKRFRDRAAFIETRRNACSKHESDNEQQ